MEDGKVILEGDKLNITLRRLCEQLIENYTNFSDACIIGLQPRGVELSDRLVKYLRNNTGNQRIEYGKLDITFYRDDFRIREKPLSASPTDIDFLVEGKRVLLIDDVLYTGRSVQAAMTALQHYGRPESVELLALVDRRFNRHLPIKANYTGITVDSLDETYVKVNWGGGRDEHKIFLFPNKND